MTKSFVSVVTAALFCLQSSSYAFTTLSSPAFQSTKQQTVVCGATPTDNSNNDDVDLNKNDRRNFLESVSSVLGVAAMSSFVTPNPAGAIPMATTSEFEGLLKGGAKSVQIVEFNGVKSEIVTVKLVDGTVFGISDVIESPYDPRSPLKIAATCREYKIPTKFVGLESVLSSTSTTSKKKQVYMNNRVLEAAKKEKEKKERMAQDEEDRLRQIREMEEMEMAATAATATAANDANVVVKAEE
mmetsp:Transcript_29998/g.39263  ORF Transcript_29998/g.39263 Transcript_29998/m.39263 type:complete len:242 (-) Transcript_29998:32-757(-)